MVVQIRKGNQDLGMTVVRHYCPKIGKAGIFVERISTEGAAHLSGRIVMHDQIKTIDGEDMQKYTSMHANTFKRDHPHITSAYFRLFLTMQKCLRAAQ